MANHGFAAYGLKIATRYRPDELVRVDDIDGSGLNLLHLAHGLVQDLSAAPYTDARYQQYMAIDEIEPLGHTLLFATNYGRYGVEGEIINTTNHEITHKYGEEESAVTSTRNMLIVVPGDRALFFAERYGGRGASSVFLRQMKAAFRARFEDDNLILHTESLVDHEGWHEFVERARLTGVKIVRYGLDSDIASGLNSENVGRLVYEMKPRRGMGGLGQELKQRMLTREVKAQQIFGLAEELETDETQLSLDDGYQQKQLVVGSDELPALIHPIESGSDDRPDDSVVYGAMRAKATGLGRQLGLEFPVGWGEGDWSDLSLAMKMEALRER